MNRSIIRLTGLLMVMLAASVIQLRAISIDEVPNVHVADRSRYVSNPSGILSAECERTLNSKIGRLWDDTSVELVVVAVDEVDPTMTPEEFATKLFEKWGIGKRDKDNGVLMLISEKDHAGIIRTGYGVEGALPDIVSGRLLRNEMFPLFREGRYDEGVTTGVDRIDEIVRNPELADELKSKYENDAYDEEDISSEDLFKLFLTFGGIASVILFIVVAARILNTTKEDDVTRYRSLESLSTIGLFACFLTLGMALPAYLLLRYKMHRIRRHKRNCPHCSTRMELIDEEHDNDYLTSAQDTEEKLNSIDYDVWHCPKCSHTDVIPYINRTTNYKVCEKCGARAKGLVGRSTLYPATVSSEGVGEDIYVCKHCGDQTRKRFKIPRKPDPAAAAAAGAILGSTLGRGGGGFSGGGFSGGSFGGGMTGGGGAGGRW